MIGIYMFENKLNGKKYVGQSTNIAKRKSAHINQPSLQSKFDLHLNKLGVDAFNFFVLEECTVEELDEKEIYWINFYDTVNSGYNIRPGGQKQFGENNIQAKLTEAQVLEIIKLLEEHQLNNKEIAQLYSVSNNTIDGINRCLNWTHLHSYQHNIRQENLNKLFYPHSSFSGENSPTAKIQEDLVLKIIQTLSSEDFKSLAQTARDYNTTIHIVSDINRCKTWTYLHNFTSNIRDEAKQQRLKQKGAD